MQRRCLRRIPWAAAAFRKAADGNTHGQPWSAVAENNLPLQPWCGHLHISCPSLMPSLETFSKCSPPCQETAGTTRRSSPKPLHQMHHHGGHTKLPSWDNPRGSGRVKAFPGATLPAGDGRAVPNAPSCTCQPLPGI